MKLPRVIASTPPPRETGLVRAQDIGALTRTGGQEFEAIAGAGRALQAGAGLAFRVQQQKQKISDDTQTDKISQNMQIWAGEQEEALKKTLIETPDDQIKALAEYKKSYDKMLKQELDGASTGVQRNIKSLSSQMYPTIYNRARSISSAKFIDYTIATETEMANTEASAGDIEAANNRIDALYNPKGVIGKMRAAAEKDKNTEIHKRGAIENTKPILIAAIEKDGNKDDGIKVLNSITAELTKDGTLTKAEAAEANKVLGDWMDNYVAGRIKRAKEAEKLTTRQTYQELMPEFLKPETAEQRYDMVDQSRLSKADKEKWFRYVKGSYKDAPTVNKPSGHEETVAAVLDAMTLQKSPQEAYDDLMEARFVDRSITDAQFEWGIDKIDNPYPKHLIGDIRNALKANTGIGWFDNEKDKEVNEKLLTFVDNLIETDSVPKFDFDKQLAAVSSKYRWGLDSGFEIGTITTIQGTEWEVVGFDKNGEPLMEPVR